VNRGHALSMSLARAEDCDFLWEMLFYASHANEQAVATVQSIRSDPDLAPYLAGWTARAGLCVIASQGGRQIGAAWLRNFTAADSSLATFVDVSTPELAVAVVPSLIGGGVGSRLLEELTTEADAREIPQIVLSVRDNNPAVRLYQRHGFVLVDRIVNRVGGDSVKMIRSRVGC